MPSAVTPLLRQTGVGPAVMVFYLAGLIVIQLMLVTMGRRYPVLPC